MKENKAVSEFIEAAPVAQQELLIALRALIIATVPTAKESFKWKRPVYHTEKDFCYLDKTKKHVTLGFFNFEKITDSNQRLEGTGKQMRHIKILTDRDFNMPVFRKMIAEAATF